MMGVASTTRNALLLFGALLLICSAANGVPDEVRGELQKIYSRPFGGALHALEVQDQERTGDVKDLPSESVQERALRIASEKAEIVRVWKEATVESKEEVEEKKPEGVVAKVWSYLSGFTSPFGKVVPDVEAIRERRRAARAEGEESHGWGRIRHEFGHHRRHHHHHGLLHSFFHKIRHAIWQHPKTTAAAAVVSSSEPLVHEDGMSAASGFRAKMTGIVGKVLEEYYASSITSGDGTTCIGILEEQVKKLVKSLKSALQEQICLDDAASFPEQKFCNLFHNHPKMATLMVFSKADVNPVTVALMRTSTAGVCTSSEDNSELLDSMHQVERLARHLPLPMIRHGLGMSKYNMHEHMQHHMPGMFQKHENEHDQDQHHMFGRHMFGMFRRHRHESEEQHEADAEPLEHEGEKHWWHHGHKEMNSDEFSHDGRVDENTCKDCFLRGVHHLARGVRMHMAITCQSATNPKLISACKFAKEHKCLVKTYLAMKMRLWEMVAFHCAQTCGASPGHMFHFGKENHQYAPNLGAKRIAEEFVGEHIKELARDVEPAVGEDVSRGSEVPMPRMPRLTHWLSGGCAKHRANQAFRKALLLKGHVVGMSNDNDAENGVDGIQRTHLVVGTGGPYNPWSPTEEQLSDLQDRMTKLVGAAMAAHEHGPHPELNTEVILFKPFHRYQHHEGSGWTGFRNFRTSAEPHVEPASEGQALPDLVSSIEEHIPHFRISAMPRTSRNDVARSEVADNEESRTTDSEIELQDKTEKDVTESGRAEL